MLKLHIANKNYSSWSLRPWVLMKTVGIPFEEVQHYFPENGPSYPEFIKFSPTGLVLRYVRPGSRRTLTEWSGGAPYVMPAVHPTLPLLAVTRDDGLV